MDWLKRIAALIPLLAPYPMWVKALVGAWILLSAVVVMALLFAPRSTNSSPRLAVTGNVRSQSGGPIGAAAVELEIGSDRHEEVSDSEGVFSIEIGPGAEGGKGRIRIMASGYHMYDRIVTVSDSTQDLGSFVLHSNKGEQHATHDDPIATLRARREAVLAPPQDALDRYEALVRGQKGGVVKLLSERAIQQNRAIQSFSGEGRYYSFLRREHEYGQGSDIKYEAGRLATGFAGLDYGYFLNLGDVALSELLDSSASPPRWLPKAKHEAWRFMWTYTPPTVTVEVRRAQREARTKVMDGTSLTESTAATPGSSYLLRSITFHEADLLIAIRAEQSAPDGSIVLAWALLRSFDTPVATGPEPEL